MIFFLLSFFLLILEFGCHHCSGHDERLDPCFLLICLGLQPLYSGAALLLRSCLAELQDTQNLNESLTRPP